MKKWISLLLVLAVVLSLAACAKDQEKDGQSWRSLLQQGKEQLKTEPRKAMKTLEKALQKAPENEREAIYFALVDASVAAEDGEAAMGYYQKAEEAGWDNANLEARWEKVRKLYENQNQDKEQSLVDSGGLYTVTRMDFSQYTDENRATGALMYYDLLEFAPSLPQYASANAVLKQDYEAFALEAQEGIDMATLDYAAQAGYLLQSYIQTEVSYMDDDYICVLHTSLEWMGGHTTQDCYAHVFSRKNGLLLNLGDILGRDKDAVTSVRQTVIDYMDEQGDIWVKNAYKQVREMGIGEFNFYLSDEGMIVIVFDSSELTSAIHGNVEIVYPIPLAELKK